MKDFLKNLIKQIVDNPDEVKVEESTDPTGRIDFLISVADSDMGRVIGKAGKVINAIRTIARIMAIRQGIRIKVDLKDTPNHFAETDVTAQEAIEAPVTPEAIDETVEAEALSEEEDLDKATPTPEAPPTPKKVAK